jgi:hypothetical protein
MEQGHSHAAYTMISQSINTESPINNRKQLLQAMTEMAKSGGDFAGGFFETIVQADGKKTNPFLLCLESAVSCESDLVEGFISLLVAVVRSVGIDPSHLTSLFSMIGDRAIWPEYSAMLLHGMAEMAPAENRFAIYEHC